MTERDAQSQVVEPVEIPKTEPTSVLEYLVLQRPDLIGVAGEYVSYENHMGNVQHSIGRYFDNMDVMTDRLEASMADIHSRLTQIRSSMSIGATYLKLIEEFKDQFTPTQIRDIFVQAVKINNELSIGKIVSESHEDNKRRTLLRQAQFGKLDAAGKVRFMEQRGVIAPAWFKGTKTEWYTLVVNHGNFTVIINKDKILRVEQTPVGSYNIYEQSADIGSTVKGGVPSWFLDLDSNLPTPEQVTEEYREDEEEKKVYQALQSERLTQVDRLKKSTTQKFSKSVVFVENERRDLEEASSEIFRALFYLDVNENTNEYPNYEDLNSISPKDFENSVILPEQATKRAIEGFADRLKLDPEVVALYIEDILREVVGHNDMSVLRSIMDFISSSPTQEDIFKLKGQDKKMHNFLKYRLLPLVSLMSKEEISYLQELAGSTDSPFEFIVELGDIISEQFDAMQGDENADKMVKELRAFSMRFMNKNKDDFIIKAMGIFISKSKTVKQGEYSLDPEIEAVYQDAEEIEEELKRTNIANWNVKLSDGYHLETGREQVVGTTLEEYEESIDALFQKSGRAISIKTSSMVRALDWFLGIPEEFLRIWPKEEVDGVEYYKVKRGAVRIFCHLDRNNQEMTFFPYQKDDMAYHFRS